jgi:hypothetical protein
MLRVVEGKMDSVSREVTIRVARFFAVAARRIVMPSLQPFGA